MAQAKKCQRFPESYLVWQGNLAWLTGETEEAATYWQQLGEETMLVYTKQLLLHGEVRLGGELLDILNQKFANKRLASENSSFFETLGDLNHYAGKDSKALVYHLRAWQLGNRSYQGAYQLAREMHQFHDCGQVIEILEEGLKYKTWNYHKSYALNFSYYELLASCSAKMNRWQAAEEAYREAAIIFEEAQSEWPAGAVQQLTLERRLQYLNEIIISEQPTGSGQE